jgi:hypothetical protein
MFQLRVNQVPFHNELQTLAVGAKAHCFVPATPAGDGVPVNPAIAHRLLLLLAELGSPEAQADVGFHLALGVEPVAPNPRDQLFECASA